MLIGIPCVPWRCGAFPGRICCWRIKLFGLNNLEETNMSFHLPAFSQLSWNLPEHLPNLFTLLSGALNLPFLDSLSCRVLPTVNCECRGSHHFSQGPFQERTQAWGGCAPGLWRGGVLTSVMIPCTEPAWLLYRRSFSFWSRSGGPWQGSP